MSTTTRVLLILALAAALVAIGWLWRGQRTASAIRAHQETITATADTLARLHVERERAQQVADSLAREAAHRDSLLAASRTVTAGLVAQVRATADSLRAIGATTVPIAEYDAALLVIERQEVELSQAADLATTLRAQVEASARLRGISDSTAGVWQRRAERAEALLSGVSAPRSSRGWPIGAYVAVGGVTAAACSEGPLSLGCLSGIVALASRF